jgi:predicted ATPase
MLIEFRVENHRSLRDEQAFTMVASSAADENDPRPRSVPGSTDPLLPVAVIYGANASGKSNLLSALAFMREAVNSSVRRWSPDEPIPRTPFAWGPKATAPSLFEIAVVIEGTKYCYGFEANDEAFTEEWLYAWPDGEKRTLFEREGMVFRYGEDFRGQNKTIESVTGPNALYLSAADQLRHPGVTALSSWFRALRTISDQGSDHVYVNTYMTTIARLLDSTEGEPPLRSFPEVERGDRLIDQFRDLLQNADVGIVDFRVIKTEIDPGRRVRRRVEVRHQGGSDDAWLPLEEESRGTQRLFRIGIPILGAIRDGRVLVIDELEASLHPILAQQIVQQFNDPAVNTRNAQLIFTTHDTNLLGSLVGGPALRRDQVWLTEKDAEGATVVYPLTDYQPREPENLERGYLQGRYGAIPFLGDLNLSGT